MRYIVLLLTLSLVIYYAEGQFRRKREAENDILIKPEKECLSAGGHCLLKSKCPTNKISTTAECPRQKALGAVCCHSAHIVGETRCEYLTGECVPVCSDELKVEQAENCPVDTFCCALV